MRGIRDFTARLENFFIYNIDILGIAACFSLGKLANFKMKSCGTYHDSMGSPIQTCGTRWSASTSVSGQIQRHSRDRSSVLVSIRSASILYSNDTTGQGRGHLD